MKNSKQSRKGKHNLKQKQKQRIQQFPNNQSCIFKQKNDSYMNNFINFTNYQKIKDREQLKLLSKLDYAKQQLSVRNEQSDLFNYCRQKIYEPNTKNIQLKIQQSTEGYKLIDQKAVMFRGKLVYLCDDTDIKPNIGTNQGLVQLLKNNKVYLKQYLYGNRSEILSNIQMNRQNQQKQLMNKYIEQYISPQKTGNIQIFEWYNEAKNSIFQN